MSFEEEVELCTKNKHQRKGYGTGYRQLRMISSSSSRRRYVEVGKSLTRQRREEWVLEDLNERKGNFTTKLRMTSSSLRRRKRDERKGYRASNGVVVTKDVDVSDIEGMKEALNFANGIPKEIEVGIESASSLIMIELAVALARTIRIAVVVAADLRDSQELPSYPTTLEDEKKRDDGKEERRPYLTRIFAALTATSDLAQTCWSSFPSACASHLRRTAHLRCTSLGESIARSTERRQAQEHLDFSHARTPALCFIDDCDRDYDQLGQDIVGGQGFRRELLIRVDTPPIYLDLHLFVRATRARHSSAHLRDTPPTPPLPTRTIRVTSAHGVGAERGRGGAEGGGRRGRGCADRGGPRLIEYAEDIGDGEPFPIRYYGPLARL
ncbi:hypothetical protein C8R45DRAFT_946406 [Mycena sanguinolenta]|nr:hypothetical protein C8R45DRAFT_946406 [Mycena sanguinolenta]